MSWFNQQVLKTDEAQGTSATVLSSRFQIGDRVKVWLDDQPDGSDSDILGFVAGIRHLAGYVYYDIAVEIGQTGFYAVLNNVHGYVTPPHFTDCPKSYREVEISSETQVALRRSSMKPVKTDSTEVIPMDQLVKLADDFSVRFDPTQPSIIERPGLKLVPLNLPSLELTETTAPD